MARSRAAANCWMPESVCFSMIFGNALGRSFFFAVLQFFVVYLFHSSVQITPRTKRL
jgi:hypothetical protein